MEQDKSVLYLTNEAKPLVDSIQLSNYYTIANDIHELNRHIETTGISFIDVLIMNVDDFEKLQLYLTMTGVNARLILANDDLLELSVLASYEKLAFSQWKTNLLNKSNAQIPNVTMPVGHTIGIPNHNEQLQQSPTAPVFFEDTIILESAGQGGEPIQTTTSKPIHYEEDPLHVKTRNIQKKLFANQQWSNHKIIGLWSPTGKTGVTLTSINLALSFAEQRIYTTVLEALSPQPNLKTHISRYTKTPSNWVSYASCIQEENEPNKASWIYQNVVFLPATQKDLHYTWNPPLIEAYMTTSKIADITLVDFPSGHLADYSLDALNYVDELWIVFDDNYPTLLKWKEYIHWLKETHHIQIYGIMGRTYSFSKPTMISQEMDIPILTTIPALDQEIMSHYYQKQPLWANETIKQALMPSYQALYTHVFPDQPPMKKYTTEETTFTRHVKSWLKRLHVKTE